MMRQPGAGPPSSRPAPSSWDSRKRDDAGRDRKGTGNGPEAARFEVRTRRTPMGIYDSSAAWYITRSSMMGGWTGRKSLVQERKFRDFETELYSMPQDPVTIANGALQEEGTVVTADDGSKVMMVRYNEPGAPGYEFWLLRFTGEHAAGDRVYVDFGWIPPVASRERPLDGNMDPPRDSLDPSAEARVSEPVFPIWLKQVMR